jgi:hypothetical protein
MLGLLDPQCLVIDQHVHRLAPEPRIDGEAEVMEPNLAILPHLAGLLAEAEDAPKAARLDLSPLGIPQDDLRRHVVQPPRSS